MQTVRSRMSMLDTNKGKRAQVATSQSPEYIADIVPLGQPFSAGPWRITVAEVLAGAGAEALIAEANAENLDPESGNASIPDGLTWVAARLTVQSMSDGPHTINLAGFAATGADGVLRRPPTIDMPEPALQGVVEAGGALEGWIPFLVDDPASATMWLDSPFMGGNWADAIFALSEAAAPPPAPSGDAADTDDGADPSRPVAIGETVRTGGWDVTVEEVVFDQEVIDRADFRLRALGLQGVLYTFSMIGIRLSLKNHSAYPAFFSTTALQVAGPDGDPWDHVVTLTPPNPAISQEYLPGASGSGWAAFELPSYAATDLIRVLPFPIGGSPRYVAFTGGGVAAEPAAGEDDATVIPRDFAAGDAVVVGDDPVNLRADASASAEIVAELSSGTELVITGEMETADGYDWYPVEVTATGEAGFVAQEFIEPAG